MIPNCYPELGPTGTGRSSPIERSVKQSPTDALSSQLGLDPHRTDIQHFASVIETAEHHPNRIRVGFGDQQETVGMVGGRCNELPPPLICFGGLLRKDAAKGVG
jgi:hypothetical protein